MSESRSSDDKSSKGIFPDENTSLGNALRSGEKKKLWQEITAILWLPLVAFLSEGCFAGICVRREACRMFA